MKRIKTNKKIKRKVYSNQTGITLVALVVTIVVLLILAGVSVNTLFGNGGIIKKAQEAQNKMNEATQNDLEGINELNEWIDNVSSSNSKSTVNLTGTSWKIVPNAFVSSPADGCYVLDLTIKRIESSEKTYDVCNNYISTYLWYYTSGSSGSSGLIPFAGSSLNDENPSQYVKYLDTKYTDYYVITINGGRDANNETLADWLNTYGENITNLQ